MLQWIYRGDDWLLVRRWQQLIAMRDEIDIVQIISWNGALSPQVSIKQWAQILMLVDYGESHYIGPIKGAQPNSEAWVNGFDHTAWLHLCGYFAHLFKYERRIPSEPTADIVPNEDRVFVWARPHPRDAEAYEDPVGRPRGWELVRTMSR